MADEKGSALDAQLGANVADADLFFTVDVSDTTMAASGTDKNITRAELELALASDGIDTSAVHTGDAATGSFITGVFPDGLTVGDLPGNTILGNNTASIGDAVALSSADVLALLGLGPISSPVPIVDGGTGQTTQQAALDALAGGVTNNRVLAGNGTHVTLRALTVSDLPTGTTSSTVPVGGVIAAAGPQGDASHTQVLTWNAAGQLTAATNTAIALAATGDATGTLPGALTLAASGVTATSYGDSTHVAQFTVDAKGRITTAANVTITGAAPTGAAGGDLTGTFPNPTIAAGAVTLAKQANLAANSFQGNNTGSAATPLALTVAQAKTLLAIATGDVSGLGTAATHATGDFLQTANNLSDVTASTARTNLGLGSAATANTGTGAGAVPTGGVITAGGPTGDASHVAQVTYNAAGQVTTVSSVAIALAGSAITSGTVPIGQLPTGTTSSTVPLGGVITGAGPQGDASHTQVLTFNNAGQLTTVTNTAIALAASAITSGTLAVANGGTNGATASAAKTNLSVGYSTRRWARNFYR